MQHKNNILIYSGLSLAAGLLIGFLSWHHIPVATPFMSTNDSSMPSMMGTMSADLQGKTGDAFDKAFLSEMIVHHQGAIDMATLAQTNAKHQAIKDLAGNIITAQTKEIAEMKAWQKSWYNQ
jgi:uncharacterized protein (DUF305 family)